MKNQKRIEVCDNIPYNAEIDSFLRETVEGLPAESDEEAYEIAKKALNDAGFNSRECADFFTVVAI